MQDKLLNTRSRLLRLRLQRYEQRMSEYRQQTGLDDIDNYVRRTSGRDDKRFAKAEGKLPRRVRSGESRPSPGTGIPTSTKEAGIERDGRRLTD